MSGKKIALFTILGLSSMFMGAIFGLIDIYGFIDGRHELSIKLILSGILFMYISLITVFILNFAPSNRVYTFFTFATILFALPFYIMQTNLLMTLLSAAAYAGFLGYAYNESLKRSKLFITFQPREIFFPVLRNSFTFLMILLAIVAYSQTRVLISQNSLIHPDLVRIVSKPSIYLMNKQFESPIQKALAAPEVQQLSDEQKEAAVRQALRQIVTNMQDAQTGTIYGIPASEIPIEDATIHVTDSVVSIDITPVIEQMLPQISFALNSLLEQYQVVIPFIIAFLVFVILQPFVIVINIFESLITLIIFQILLSTSFIHVKTIKRSRYCFSLNFTLNIRSHS